MQKRDEQAAGVEREIQGEIDGVQTPVGGEIDGTQSPDPISDPSQKLPAGEAK
jgi:hypothetical protein